MRSIIGYGMFVGVRIDNCDMCGKPGRCFVVDSKTLDPRVRGGVIVCKTCLDITFAKDEIEAAR